MTQHTPEPWVLFKVGDRHVHFCPASETDKTSILTVTEEDGVEFGAVYRDEDARRIVACVNACAGWTTEQLEAMELGSMKETISRLADYSSDPATWEARATKEASRAVDLQTQVDELLAAAKHMLSNVAFVNFGGEWNNSFVEDADLTEYCQPLQDAINKITGEPK